MTVTWNSAFEATPAGTDQILDGDNKIRQLKNATREQIQGAGLTYASAIGTNGAFTVTLDISPTTLGTGQRFWFQPNMGITALSAGSVNFNAIGGRNLVRPFGNLGSMGVVPGDVTPGDMIPVVIDTYGSAAMVGPNWQRGWVLLESRIAATTASVAFTAISNLFQRYALELDDVIPISDGVQVHMRISTNAGVSWIAASVYQYEVARLVGGTLAGATAISATSLRTAFTLVGNVSDEGLSGTIYIDDPMTSTRRTTFRFNLGAFNQNTDVQPNWGAGSYQGAAATDAVQFFFESGNISSGNFRLYGLRR